MHIAVSSPVVAERSLAPRWLALFGRLDQLIGPEDCVIADDAIDPALLEALEATRADVDRYGHDDIEGARARICQLCSESTPHRVFVLACTEQALDTGSGGIWRIQEACQRYGALLLLVSRADGS